MRKMTLAVALIAFASAFTSCNKEDDNNSGSNNGGSGSGNLTAMEKMIVGKWQPVTETHVTIRTGGAPNDTQSTLQPCTADDVFTFTDAKKYTVSDGSNACSNPGATYTSTFPWYVASDSSFDFTHGPGRLTPKIYYLDNSTLKLVSHDVSSAYYATYTRK